jgi:hypothetical protein
MNMPWAYYNLGELYLYLNKPYESMLAHAKAIQFSTAEFMIETSLKSLERLSCVKAEFPAYEWVRQALLLGLLAKFSDEIDEITKNNYLAQLGKISSMKRENTKKITSPVVVVAGGCDPKIENEISQYEELLLAAFSDYKGTIISGGTTSGISGLVGTIQKKYGKKIHTIGYLPVGKLPVDAIKDHRYSELRQSEGEKCFSPLEPLQAWIDIIASGISPAEVKVLGINGGNIASIEYKLALALGVEVAVVEESGREAGKLLKEDEWNDSVQLSSLPKDAIEIEKYIMR